MLSIKPSTALSGWFPDRIGYPAHLQVYMGGKQNLSADIRFDEFDPISLVDNDLVVFQIDRERFYNYCEFPRASRSFFVVLRITSIIS